MHQYNRNSGSPTITVLKHQLSLFALNPSTCFQLTESVSELTLKFKLQ